MCCRLLALLVVLALLIAGCNKPQKQAEINSTQAQATDSPTMSATPTLATLTTPTPAPAIDRNARVMILSYHRFEDRPHDSLAIAPEEFRPQMQALKDNGIAVIPMKDFLAWRQGEKNISASELHHPSARLQSLQHILPYCSRRATVAFVYAPSQV